MRYFKFILLLVVLSLIALGCSPSPETDEEAAEEISMLSMGTHPTGTLFNTLGSGIGTVLSQQSDYEIRVIGASGPVEWFPQFIPHEIDLGVLNNWDAQMGWRGEYEYEPVSNGEGFPVRLIAVGSHNSIAGIVAADSDIESAEDIKGKRFVTEFTGSGGITAQAKAFLANHNIALDDVREISVPSVVDGVTAVQEGRTDASASAVLGMAAIEELDATRGARFIGFDPSPEAVERMQEEFPGYLVEIEAGPPGVHEDLYAMAYDIYLVARADLPDNVAYDLVNTLWEHYEELAPIHPLFAHWTPDKYVSDIATIPYHPGVIEFYEEEGVWDEEMENLQNELLEMEQ